MKLLFSSAAASLCRVSSAWISPGMRTSLSLPLLMLFLLSAEISSGQTTIAQQDFESTPATPTLTFTTSDVGTVSGGTGFSSGSTTGSDAPSSASLSVGGSRGYRFQGAAGPVSRTLTFAAVNTTSYTGVQFSFRVAGMSIGSTGNGMDNTNDQVLLEVSPDGGTTWYQQSVLKVTGTGANARWAFGVTGIGSRAYLANNTLTTHGVTNNTAGGATLTGANAISTITVTSLPSVASLQVRITLQADAANESWIIDNAILTGTPATPTTTSLSPTTAPAGDAGFTLTVNGTNFISGLSTVTWNGSNRTTTFVSATQLTATISAADVATNGTAAVGVTTTGAPSASNTQTFTINPATPTTTSLSPINTPAGGGDFTLTVNGTNFISGLSTVTWNGSNRTTTFVSSTQLTATILAADIASVGTATVGVTTTGATAASNTQSFAILTPPPGVNGTITAGEYGTHTNGQNQQSNGPVVTYMTWDATNLYVGVASANVGEGFVLYLDKDPQVPVDGGSNANGTLPGNPYDGTNFAGLPFRADLVMYVKSGYREYRTADGSNGWSAPTTSFGTYAENGGSATREFSIPWSAIGGMPASFNFFSYLTSSGGFVYGQTARRKCRGQHRHGCPVRALLHRERHHHRKCDPHRSAATALCSTTPATSPVLAPSPCMTSR